MKVLVACEESQRVTLCFRARGHIAYSCDILPCSGMHPEWHIKGDALTCCEIAKVKSRLELAYKVVETL